MNENLSKVCRICLTEGSRNIFQRTVAHDALYNVSSLSRISEKLRYVTLLKIDELENLPPMICDLCIVQLNVAYNFKRQASESDTKLRQYLIENGIDMMKDPLSLPAPIIAPPPATPSILRPAIVAAPPPRTIQRSNSTASSSVLEIRSVNRTVPPQLRPICIKVETPETTTERSESEGGDLHSEISPLSSATIPAIVVEPATTVVVAPVKPVTVESSPASSKTSLSERSGAMVMVSSENVSMQGDEDFVQNILGSNSSLATSSKGRANPEAVTKESKAKDSTAEQNKKRDPVKALLSKLTIDMVNSAKFPKTKLRTKPKQQQKVAKPISKPKRMRSTFDYSQLFAKRNNSAKSKSDNVISENKLRSLREKIREEKESGSKKVAEESKRRKTIAFVDLDALEAGASGDGPSSSRVSLP